MRTVWVTPQFPSYLTGQNQIFTTINFLVTRSKPYKPYLICLQFPIIFFLIYQSKPNYLRKNISLSTS